MARSFREALWRLRADRLCGKASKANSAGLMGLTLLWVVFDVCG